MLIGCAIYATMMTTTRCARISAGADAIPYSLCGYEKRKLNSFLLKKKSPRNLIKNNKKPPPMHEAAHTNRERKKRKHWNRKRASNS